MVVFRVLRACKGAGGFIGELGQPRGGAAGFNNSLPQASSGAGGFNLAMFLCPVREIVLPEGLRHPKFGVLGLAGRVCSRNSCWRGRAGRVFRATGCCTEVLSATGCPPCRRLWGFAALEGGWRRVVGVSDL